MLLENWTLSLETGWAWGGGSTNYAGNVAPLHVTFNDKMRSMCEMLGQCRRAVGSGILEIYSEKRYLGKVLNNSILVMVLGDGKNAARKYFGRGCIPK